MPATASHPSTLVPVRKPIRRATPTTITSEARLATSEVSTWAHRALGPGDRHGLEALEDPALQVHEEPVGGVRDARRDGDEQDAGQHVVDVRIRSGVDRTAEDVDEQQHESDRGDRGRDDGVRAAHDVAQRPPGEDGGVFEDVGGHDLPCLSAPAVLSAATPSVLPSSPTSARNTSSRLGCFSTYSTFAGGSSCFSSARVPLTMIRP